jgi:hypothetical protein
LLFEGKYPDLPEAYGFVDAMNHLSMLSVQFINQGIKDGSIVTDEDPAILSSVILNAVIGTSQRVIPRSEHYDEEHGAGSEVIVNKVLSSLLSSVKG